MILKNENEQLKGRKEERKEGRKNDRWMSGWKTYGNLRKNERKKERKRRPSTLPSIQVSASQSSHCATSPTHCKPPFCGRGLLHSRLLERTPTPQLPSHSPHSSGHPPHTPSTISVKARHRSNYNSETHIKK